MFRITGKRVSTRIAKARGGARVRRLPSIVLGNGAVIKIHPNRSVLVSARDIRANANRISGFTGMVVISETTAPFNIVSLLDIMNVEGVKTEPIVEEKVEPPTEPPPVVEPEPIIEPEPVVEPEPIIEPEPVVEEPPPPQKKRRRRRTKAQIAADKAESKKG